MGLTRPALVKAAVVALAVLYGAGSQYLGSFSAYPWMTDVSLLSAPWLALAFLVGSTQRDPKAAALLGLGCTFAAWVGYGAMTLSPIEGAEMNGDAVLGFVKSQRNVILGGLVTGPLFGWFGHRWRVDRAWLGALATATAFCLEPAARSVYGLPIQSSPVLALEIAAGVALAVYFAIRLVARSGRRLRPL